MSEKIIFATGNAGKLKEIREILKDLNREIVTMREAGFEGEIEDNGTTFRENAAIKAQAVWEKTGGIVLADDSGLVIDYLNGEPGVDSARYLGDTPYEEKNRILIERVKDAKGKERSARFMCNIAAVLPDGRVIHTEAAMEGEIDKAAAGNGGFGYDPILWLPASGKTSAELTAEEKKEWIARQSGVTVGSDAFFPFGDNIERAHKSGVDYIAQEGGSVRDDHGIESCDKYGITLACTGIRLLTH